MNCRYHFRDSGCRPERASQSRGQMFATDLQPMPRNLHRCQTERHRTGLLLAVLAVVAVVLVHWLVKG